MATETAENPTALILSTSQEKNGRALKEHIVRQSTLSTEQIGFRGPKELLRMPNAARLITENLRLVVVHAIRPFEKDMALGLATDLSKRLVDAQQNLESANQVVVYGPLWGNLGRGEKGYLKRELENGSVDSVPPYYGENGSKHLHLMDWLLQRGVDLSSEKGGDGMNGSLSTEKHLLVTDRRVRWANELTKLWSDQAGVFRSRILVRDLAGKEAICPEELVELCRSGLRNVLIHLTDADHLDHVLDLVEAADDEKNEVEADVSPSDSVDQEELIGNSLKNSPRIFLFSEMMSRLFPDAEERSIAFGLLKDSAVPHAQRSPSWSGEGEVPKAVKTWMKKIG